MRERRLCQRARRIVVKVGSSTLTADGTVRPRVFGELARQVSALRDQRREVVIVSSGAIAVGSRKLGWSHAGRSIPEKQAAAAVGQIGLVELYQRRFERLGQRVAQVLLTRIGLDDRERFLNARHTLQELLRLGVVPVVNENDTVSTDEIRFGDNDNLSATIVNLVGADLLVILTDVDGFFPRDPDAADGVGRAARNARGAGGAARRSRAEIDRAGRRAKVEPLDVVERITPEIERAAGGSNTAFGRGGMLTKLEAARSAALSGCATVVCNGRRKDVILRVAAGERVGTLFLPGRRLASRKHWLAFTTRTRGALVIDEGAAHALAARGRSLLPAGIVEVRGRFGIGDPVSCVDAAGRELARGLVSYGSAEVDRIKGRSTREIAGMLGYSNGDSVIHRDDLVILESGVGSDA